MTKNTAKNITAIVDGADMSEAGAIVYINFHGETDRVKLEDAWVSEGLDPALIPEFNSFRSALTRAVDEVARHNGAIKLKRAGGWEIVEKEESANVGESAGTVECVVELNAFNTPDVSPEDHAWADDIRSAYYRHLHTVTAADTSAWVLHALMPRVNALTLRERGGVYFVARQYLEVWRRMMGCLRAASAHRPAEIPAVDGDEAAEAVLDALLSETDRAVADCETVLDDADATTGALKTQGNRLGKLVEKLGAFDELVGPKLDALREKIATARAATTEAILASTEEV